MAAISLSSNVRANCHVDGNLVAIRDQVINERFMALSASPPPIVVCDAYEFPPGVAGVYGGGVIRIPAWTLSTPMRRTNVAHELAHAAVDRSACRDQWSGATQGHGSCFFRQVLLAGLTNEAYRVAQHYASSGGLDALAAAGGAASTPFSRQAPQPEPNLPFPPVANFCVERMPVAQRCGRRGCWIQHVDRVIPC